MSGLVDGKLARPPIGSRCVCSEFPGARGHIDPLSYEGDATAAWDRLGQLVKSLPCAEIKEQSQTYLLAIMRTAVFGFPDSVEFRLQSEASVIHVRSASPFGVWDLGENRRRVEAIRDRWSSAE